MSEMRYVPDRKLVALENALKSARAYIKLQTVSEDYPIFDVIDAALRETQPAAPCSYCDGRRTVAGTCIHCAEPEL